MERENADTPFFPVFVNLAGTVVTIAGAGRVAARRAETLMRFGARVRVVAPAVSPEMRELLRGGKIEWIQDFYRSWHLDGSRLAVAATDDREVNRKVGVDALERGIPASVADRREECTFLFPAVAESRSLVAGIVSKSGDHSLVRRTAGHLRHVMETMDENDTGGEPRQRPGGGAGESDN